MEELIVVQLTPRQCKQMIMMNFLDSIGFFESKLSQLIIDTDKEGKIGHVSLKHNYDTSELKYNYPLDNVV